MVDKIRRIEKMMGRKEIRPNTEEIKNRKNFHRCIVASKIINKNEKFTKHNIALKRPSLGKTGLEPKFYNNVIGKRSNKKITKDHLIKFSNIK